ncbi:MAG: prolyl oligopeptidase family serine peptidase [Zavarzinella sp.]
MKNYLLFAFALWIGSNVSNAQPAPWYADKTDLLSYLDEKGARLQIADPATWAKRKAHILTQMQVVMGKLPDLPEHRPFRVTEKSQNDCGKYIQKHLTIEINPGEQLPVYLLLPKVQQKQFPAMLCLHPTSKPDGKKIPAGLSGKSDRHYAKELAEHGYVTLAPDYPNMGEYQFDVYGKGYISTTMKAIENHRRCLDYLISLPQVDASRLGVVGHSLGGHNSIFLGCFDDRVQVIISSCGFCSFPKYMKGNLTGWSHDGYMPKIKTTYDCDPKKMPWDFTEAIALLAPRTFIAVAPINDHNFDVAGVKDCIRAAKPVYQIFKKESNLISLYPEAGHDFPDDARKEAFRILDSKLKPASK